MAHSTWLIVHVSLPIAHGTWPCKCELVGVASVCVYTNEGHIALNNVASAVDLRQVDDTTESRSLEMITQFVCEESV